MDARSTSDAARMGASSDAASALLDRALFQPFLEPGERILWIGRSRPRWLRAGTAYRMFWMSLACILVVLAVATFPFAKSGPSPMLSEEDLYSVKVGIVQAAVLGALCLTFLVLGIFRRVAAVRSLSYLLSDSRAMALDRRRGGPPKTVSFGEIDHLEQNLRSDGSGEIIFDYNLIYPKNGGTAKAVPKLMFVDIENASAVRKLAEDAVIRFLSNASDTES
jgi:hypothetical protein